METLSIGQLADRSGIHLETIRYYEREGLIPAPPRKSSGHRAYPKAAARRLRFIKRAQELGFSLAEIRELLTLKVEPDQLCTDLVRKIEVKIIDIDARIEHLQAMKRVLGQLKDSCSGNCAVADCPILESFETEAS
jgi:MerR family copper efflux transcriptional regulator